MQYLSKATVMSTLFLSSFFSAYLFSSNIEDIQSTWTKAETDFHVISPGCQDLILIGNTGNGKSTYGNYLAGRKLQNVNRKLEITGEKEQQCFKIGHAGSQTKSIESLVFQNRGAFYRVWDVPGFADANSLADDVSANFLIHKLFSIVRDPIILYITEYSSLFGTSSKDRLRKLDDTVTKIFCEVGATDHLFFVLTKIPANSENCTAEKLRTDVPDIVEEFQYYKLLEIFKKRLLFFYNSVNNLGNTELLYDFSENMRDNSALRNIRINPGYFLSEQRQECLSKYFADEIGSILIERQSFWSARISNCRDLRGLSSVRQNFCASLVTDKFLNSVSYCLYKLVLPFHSLFLVELTPKMQDHKTIIFLLLEQKANSILQNFFDEEVSHYGILMPYEIFIAEVRDGKSLANIKSKISEHQSFLNIFENFLQTTKQQLEHKISEAQIKLPDFENSFATWCQNAKVKIALESNRLTECLKILEKVDKELQLKERQEREYKLTEERLRKHLENKEVNLVSINQKLQESLVSLKKLQTERDEIANKLQRITLNSRSLQAANEQLNRDINLKNGQINQSNTNLQNTTNELTAKLAKIGKLNYEIRTLNSDIKAYRARISDLTEYIENA